MDTCQKRSSCKVKWIVVVMIVMFACFSVPAAAYELCMLTGEKAPVKKQTQTLSNGNDSQQVQLVSKVQPNQDLEDIFMIPQP